MTKHRVHRYTPPATPDERAVRDPAIEREYLEGDTLDEIGRRHGLSGERVRLILLERSVVMRPAGRRPRYWHERHRANRDATRNALTLPPVGPVDA